MDYFIRWVGTAGEREKKGFDHLVVFNPLLGLIYLGGSDYYLTPHIAHTCQLLE